MENIAENIKTINNTIQSLSSVSRPVQLIAVSKQQSIEAITAAIFAGQLVFGENYLQEALPKIKSLTNYPIQWHFLGRIQSNKVKAIAQHFDWVQTVSRLDIADALNAARPPHLNPLNVCIQINIDNEASKSGASIGELTELATHISTLPRLRLRGLMVIPQQGQDINTTAETFAKVTAIQASLNQTLDLAMDTLSMGMSGDFETAILAGSTMVRIGTAIFGGRH